jgi:hypothetical protein
MIMATIILLSLTLLSSITFIATLDKESSSPVVCLILTIIFLLTVMDLHNMIFLRLYWPS